MQLFFFYLCLPLHQWVHGIHHQRFKHNIHSYLFVQNYFHRRRHGKLILKISEYNLHVHTKTPSSTTWEIPLTPILCVSLFRIWVMFITDDTHSHFSNSLMFVSFILIGLHCQYNSFLFILFPILGAALIIAP